MPLSYSQISDEVGYTGYMPYPSMDNAQVLFNNLCASPTLVDFKSALRLYRFTPEAKTPAQSKIIHMVQTGLSVARKSLYLAAPKRSTREIVKDYIYKCMPTMTLFHLLNVTISHQTFY